MLAYLAKALAKGGGFADARRCMDDAIATIAATEERWCESDILRIAGEIAALRSQALIEPSSSKLRRQ